MSTETDTEFAIRRADERGIRTVTCTTFELMRVASGHPNVVATLDGEEVLLRLATADELMESHLAALANSPAEGRPPAMTPEKAAELVAPLPI